MYPHFYVIIDFECTCWEKRSERPHEIIEFPAIVMNSLTLEIEYEFHRFVRPTEEPYLSDYCTDLTGIEQCDVDCADDLSYVLDEFSDFLEENGVRNFTVCTDGPWDFSKFLYPESQRKNIDYPYWAIHWLDIRRRFQRSFRLAKWFNIDRMLDALGMVFQGRPHSGIDDARNIARITRAVHLHDKINGKMRPNRHIHIYMPDFAGAILASHANYTSGSIGVMDPLSSSPRAEDVVSQSVIQEPHTVSNDIQTIQKCPADYNKIPHGWRPSPFMGRCGFKIQAKNFYSADTPCYPIQDLSCMGPLQKRVWASICATEFPCKPLDPEKSLYLRMHDDPSWISRFTKTVVETVNTHTALLIGATLGSCLTVGIVNSRRSPTTSQAVPAEKGSPPELPPKNN